MAYIRQQRRRDGEPAVEFHWDPLVLAKNKTFSTTIRIQVSGWWPERGPKQVAVSVYERGQEPPPGDAVRIQKGRGTFPLTGLKPGRHYHVVVFIADRLPVQNVITVPELPKPKKPEEEALDSERIRLERAKVFSEHKKLVTQEKEPPEPKRQIKVLHTHRRPSRLEVVLQRIGKDGKSEDGEISVLDFEQGGIVFGSVTGDFPIRVKKWGMAVVFLPYFDYSRQVTFFLPDDPNVKAVIDVPVRVGKEEKKPEATPRPSLWAMMKEVYREERNKGRVPSPFEFKIQRRQPVILVY